MPANTPHLLIIRLSAMGDVALVQPVVKSLRAAYPSLRITVVSNQFFAPIFAEIAGVQFHPVDLKRTHKGVKGLLRLFGELKALQPTAIADLHDVLRTKFLRLLFAANGFPMATIDKGRAEKRALTRPTNKHFVQLKTTPQRYTDVFIKLGYPFTLQLPDSQKHNNSVKRIGVAPFAQHAAKQYPLDKMEEVVAKLAEDYEVLLYGGGEAEKQHMAAWEAKYQQVKNRIGCLSFAEELKEIATLDLMISMDSGNGHLAAMQGVKVLTIWGLTHPFAGFAPMGQPESHAILPDLSQFPQIPTSVYGNNFPANCQGVWETISPQQVIQAAEKVLN